MRRGSKLDFMRKTKRTKGKKHLQNRNNLSGKIQANPVCIRRVDAMKGIPHAIR